MRERLKRVSMASNQQQDYIDQAVKRYSSLFTLPSHSRVLLFLLMLCFAGGLLTLLPFTQAYFGIAFGLGFFLIVILSDMVVCRLLRTEPIYNARRCNALSLFSSILWFVLMFFGTGLGIYFGSAEAWLKLFLLGFCGVSLLRLLVYSATLFKGYATAFISALFQPVLWLVFVYLMWPFVTSASLDVSFFVFPLVSLPIIAATIMFFVYQINRVGRKTLGVSSMSLLKTFLANWIEDVNAPLENMLEKLGTEQSVNISFLIFKAKDNVKTAMVIPALHPGPFKNVGSSFLPYLIQSELEKRLNCVVSVPHGLFGHELDLASQAQNQKIIDAVLKALKLDKFGDTTSPFVRVKSGKASACCQVFNDCALLALTVAPDTTEDLPQELGFLAIDKAEKKGLASAIVINAHNSINSNNFNLEENLMPLKEAVAESIEKTASAEGSMLRIGAAKVVPTEFTLEDGMGLGGICVIVVESGKQRAAYVTIDGNNMVSGLRERILEALREVGIDDGEVLTTDTHAVSAVVLNRRGYHPVGEVMNQEKLIDYIKNTVSEATKNLEPAEAAWRTITVPNVKVIGAKQIEGLCILTDKAMKRAKKSALILFPIASAVLIALLLLT
jgi:putative membrane protein